MLILNLCAHKKTLRTKAHAEHATLNMFYLSLYVSQVVLNEHFDGNFFLMRRVL